jgi:AcrR family transcriptional regulator
VATVQRISRAEKKAATRERLLKSAERIAAREGFARLSLDRVAEAAGLTKGAIYSNFESKEDLLLQVADRLTVGLKANDEVLAATDFKDLVKRLAEALIGFVGDHSREATLALEFMAFALRDRKLRNLVMSQRSNDDDDNDVNQWLASHASEFPTDMETFEQVIDALALGVMFRRLLWGKDGMPDDAIRWVFRRLASSSD